METKLQGRIQNLMVRALAHPLAHPLHHWEIKIDSLVESRRAAGALQPLFLPLIQFPHFLMFLMSPFYKYCILMLEVFSQRLMSCLHLWKPTIQILSVSLKLGYMRTLQMQRLASQDTSHAGMTEIDMVEVLCYTSETLFNLHFYLTLLKGWNSYQLPLSTIPCQ